MKVFLKCAVLLILALTLCACGKTSGDAPNSADPAIPTFSSALAFSSVTSSAFTMTWAGSDLNTPANLLEYEVIYSMTNNITTVADAQANGTISTAWTANLLTTNFTSMSQSTTYYVAILVRDTDGNIAISSGSQSTLCSGKIMFLTSVTNGNLGGASGADATCNANKPTGFSGSTFKALLTDATTRRACYVSGNDNCSASSTGRTGWVFGANQSICTSNYATRIGTTNALSLLQITTANTLSSTATTTYTGFNSFWGSSASNCSGFTSFSGTAITGTATGTLTGSANEFIANTIPSCATAGTIYCVEQ